VTNSAARRCTRTNFTNSAIQPLDFGRKLRWPVQSFDVGREFSWPSQS